jgi:hypothetical protein
MTGALRPLSTGDLLDRTFSLYRSHFAVFLGIVALPHLCVLAPSVWRLRLKVVEVRCPAWRRVSFGAGGRLF